MNEKKEINLSILSLKTIYALHLETKKRIYRIIQKKNRDGDTCKYSFSPIRQSLLSNTMEREKKE
jgi:hypothetical protein